MPDRLSRTEAVTLVQRLVDTDYTDDHDADIWLETLRRDLVCPHISALIFWPERPMTAEEIVDAALAYQPIALGP